MSHSDICLNISKKLQYAALQKHIWKPCENKLLEKTLAFEVEPVELCIISKLVILYLSKQLKAIVAKDAIVPNPNPKLED